jgi:hypothetical protein
MSILDDAIREHLELKRQHGADEAELKRLEDEAFGPPGRPDEPDPFAEAPTEFMATPEAAEAEAAEEGRRRINIADLQEAPAPAEPQVEATEAVELEAEATPVAPAEDTAQAAPPVGEEPPAMEHEVVAEAEAQAEPKPAAEEADAGHSGGERHAIAEQPTELFDVEAEMGAEDAAATEAASPSDEEIVEAEASEPKLAPVEPATEIHASRAETPAEAVAEEDEEDEEFWSDQRLSEELDQALEAPLTEEHEIPAPAAEEGEEHEHDGHEPESGHEDVLEETPDFLEDAPEDDELWFEQRPPKDFDFDD